MRERNEINLIKNWNTQKKKKKTSLKKLRNYYYFFRNLDITWHFFLII